MRDDPTQVKYLNNKSHRENEKDKFQILNINKKIDIFDFTEKLQLMTSSLNEAMHKIKFDYDMPIYKVGSINEKLHKTDFSVFNINAEREIESYDNKFETAVKLFKLNFKEGYPAIFLTNATYYDNTNNTLPNGMDVTSKVIIDANMFEYELVKKEKMKTNRYFNIAETLYPRILTIYIEEYDVYLKGQKPEKTEKIVEEKIQEPEEKYEEATDVKEIKDKAEEKAVTEEQDKKTEKQEEQDKKAEKQEEKDKKPKKQEEKREKENKAEKNKETKKKNKKAKSKETTTKAKTTKKK